MRYALCVGIDNYMFNQDLHGCANDANAIAQALATHEDGSANFSVRMMSSTIEHPYITRSSLKDAVADLFLRKADVVLFFYAGHGSIDACGGYLCTSETHPGEDGLSLNDVMTFACQSPAAHKIIILDSCYSGSVGSCPVMPMYSVLSHGTTIFAACDESEDARENDRHGTFTALLIDALYGGATNLLGDVTPGSIYAYIDHSIGALDSRPVFKANMSGSVSLRKNAPPISTQELHYLTDFFADTHQEYPL